jgi:hypothetical protein
MARLRIVELPMIHQGEMSETPFGVILDQVREDSLIFASDGQLSRVLALWGAKGVLVTQDTIDLADDQPAQIIESEPTGRGDANGHDFGHPGYQDPVRCSRCAMGINEYAEGLRQAAKATRWLFCEPVAEANDGR